MNVIAAPGLKVPMEHNPREYIGDAEPVQLEECTYYYVRRLADGDLLEVQAKPAKAGKAVALGGT